MSPINTRRMRAVATDAMATMMPTVSWRSRPFSDVGSEGKRVEQRDYTREVREVIIQPTYKVHLPYLFPPYFHWFPFSLWMENEDGNMNLLNF